MNMSPQDSDEMEGAHASPWVLVFACSVALAAAGHLLIKFALNAAAVVHAQGAGYWLHHPSLWFGLMSYGAGTLLWIVTVSRQEISFLFPLTSLNYAFVTLGGRLLFGEEVSVGRWAGIAVVVFGVMLMHSTGREGT